MKTNFYLLVFTFLLLGNIQIRAQQPCVLICESAVVINASTSCFTLVTPEMTLDEYMGTCEPLTVTILHGIDTVINPVPGIFNEQPLTAVTSSPYSQEPCTTDIFIRDIYPPVLSRSESFTSINCYTPVELIEPIVDECSPYTLVYSFDEFCDPIKGLVREYTWVAEDVAGNTGQLVVEYELVFDPNHLLYPGLFNIACDDPLATGCGGAPCPEVSGSPTISTDNCIPLNITYTDDIFNLYCEGYKKVLRTWEVSDICGHLLHTYIQIIKLQDLSGPIITVPSLPQVIPFDTWKNDAIPMATAIDVCGLVDFIIYEDFYDPTCDLLEITRTFTAYDDCGNFTTASVNFQVQYQFDCQIPKIPKTTCGDPVVIEANVIDGVPPYSYQWTNTGNWVIVSSSTQNPIDVVSGSGQATFTVVITDAIGCETECTRKVKCKKAKKPKKRINIDDVYSSGGILTVHWEIQEESIAKIKVWNMMGKEVAELEEMVFPGEHTTSLQLSDYTPGLYIISIDTKDSHEVRKVIIY